MCNRQPAAIVLAIAVTFCLMRQADAQPSYEIRDLTPTGYFSSEAFDINASGDAVGVASRFVGGALEKAYFKYDHSAGTSLAFGAGTVLPGGTIVGSGFREAAINDSGVIAGTARFVGGSPQARGFTFSGGSFTSLGTLPGLTATGRRPASDAQDINSSGLATGTATSGTGTISTEGDNIDVYISSASPIVDIDGDISTATRGDYGRGINNAGTIVGSSELSKATLFVGAAETSLLTGSTLASAPSVAVDLNESGEVVGYTTTGDAFFYDPLATTPVTVLPKLGGARIFAQGINEAGDIVGHGDIGFGLDDAAYGFIRTGGVNYTLRDQVVDLTVPAVAGFSDWGRIGTAWAINDSGLIVGRGDRRFDGDSFPTKRAYLLVPVAVPEPSSWLLIGAISLLGLRRRR